MSFEKFVTAQHEQTQKKLDRIEKTAGEIISNLENEKMIDEYDYAKQQAKRREAAYQAEENPPWGNYVFGFVIGFILMKLYLMK